MGGNEDAGRARESREVYRMLASLSPPLPTGGKVEGGTNSVGVPMSFSHPPCFPHPQIYMGHYRVGRVIRGLHVINSNSATRNASEIQRPRDAIGPVAMGRCPFPPASHTCAHMLHLHVCTRRGWIGVVQLPECRENPCGDMNRSCSGTRYTAGRTGPKREAIVSYRAINSSEGRSQNVTRATPEYHRPANGNSDEK